MGETIIGDLVKSQENLNRQFLGYTNLISTRRIGVENINIRGITKIQSKALSSSVFILSHITQSVMPSSIGGTGYYLTELESDGVTTSTVRVLNNNNLFIDRFENTNWVDTVNTTADYTSYDDKIVFSADEELQSSIIALNNTAYTSVSLTPQGEYDNLNAYISSDGGNSFISADWNNITSITSSTITGLVYKVIASSTASSSNDYLTDIEVNYVE